MTSHNPITNSRLSPAKHNQIFVIIRREEIEAGDIEPTLKELRGFTADRASAMLAEGCVTLVFHGYNEYPRPVVAIPEIRSWFAKLHAAWPYWSFFANRTDETVGIVASLLLPGKMVQGSEPGQYGYDYDIEALQPLLFAMFGAQNALIERLDIDEDVNQRVSEEFIDAVFCALGAAD